MGVLLKGGTVYTDGRFVAADVLIEAGRIKRIAAGIAAAGHEVIDVHGRHVLPGFVDLHVHLREPGGEHKETIATGTAAAARGGFTTVAAMPNTNPIPDRPETLQALLARIREAANVRVLPYAAITVGQKGEEVVDIARLKALGAFAFTDDGRGVQSAGVMFQAMKSAAACGAAIVAHCEDETLIRGGSFHDGRLVRQLGLTGLPSVAEAVHVARDVLLAEAAGCRYHVCHVSAKESVRVIRAAKRAGLPVTAEVTPHHLLLTEEDIPGADANYKMNPPLRSREDREALIEGLLDGTIDLIATDHAPHAAEEKARPLDEAPFGIVGLETAFPLLYTHLVRNGLLALERLIDLMTRKPCEAFGLPYGALKEGATADVTVVDLGLRRAIRPDQFASKGKNTPFAGRVVEGWPVLTMFEGKRIWDGRGVGA